MVRTGYSCTKCVAKRQSETWRCIFEGCDNWQRTGGYCLTHGTQAQRDKILWQKRSRRCVKEGCNKRPQCGGHCVAHATQVQRDKKSVLKRTAISSNRHTVVYIVLPMPRKRRGMNKKMLGKNEGNLL